MSALDLGATGITSVVGGGGKTTTIFRLGQELCAAGHSVVVTTTTKFGTDQLDGPIVETAGVDDAVSAVASVAGSVAPVVVVDHREGTKAFGVGTDVVDALPVDHVLVEADGARRRALKAPEHYEPVISPGTDLVVAVMGLSAVGGVIAEVCHRPQRVGDVVGKALSGTVEPADLVTLATSGDGAGRGVPDGARLVVVLSQVADDMTATARDVAAAILSTVGSGPPVERVVVIPAYQPGTDAEPDVSVTVAT